VCQSRPGSGKLRQFSFDSSRPSRNCAAGTVRCLLFLFVIVTAFYPAALADCTITVQGSLPPESFTAQQTVTATATCAGGFANIAWGDGTQSSSGPSPVVANHTFTIAVPPPPPQPPPPPYFVQVTNLEETPAAAYLAFPPAPAATFAGDNPQITAPVGVIAPNEPASPMAPAISIHFECDTVVDSDGTVYNAAQASSVLHLDCHATPNANVTYAPNQQQQPVTVEVATSGLASTFSSVRFPTKEIYAAWTMAPILLLLSVTVRRRRAKMQPMLGICAILCLSFSVTSCGGGFSSTSLMQPTPSGQYQVNVISVPNGSTPTGFVQTTLIVPLTVSQTQ
jgi:hypothetical protein